MAHHTGLLMAKYIQQLNLNKTRTKSKDSRMHATRVKTRPQWDEIQDCQCENLHELGQLLRTKNLLEEYVAATSQSAQTS